MRTVAVVDYGMGNLRSVSQAVRHVARRQRRRGRRHRRSPEEVRAAERVVLPGQGAMRDCMRELRDSGLQDAVLEAPRTKPLMGVCVGMQMLLDHSEEQDTPGLGLIAGAVLRFRLDGQLQPDGSRYKVPQMGWNRVCSRRSRTRSGRACPTAPGSTSCTASTPARRRRATARRTEYGARFTCAVARDNIFATQFHPEKSADHGLAAVPQLPALEALML